MMRFTLSGGKLSIFVLSFVLTFAAPAAAVTPDPIEILTAGDSITKGSRGTTPYSTGYKRRLDELLTGAGYSAEYPFLYFADSGWTANTIIAGIYDKLLDFWNVGTPANIILLHIGTNDIYSRGKSQLPAGVADEIGEILDEIDDFEDFTGTDVWVVVAQIINRADDYSDETTELNGHIRELVDARRALGDYIVTVDMENALIYNDDLYYSIEDWDTVHPNNSGYEKMAQAWFAVLDDALDYMFEVGVFDIALSQDADSGELNCSYALGTDADTAAVAWYKGTSPLTPIMTVYLPMEGGASNALLDYSGNGIAASTIGSPAWSSTAGEDGQGAYEFDGDDGLSAGENFPTSSSYTKTAWVYRTSSGGGGVNSIISGDASSGGHTLRVSNSNQLSAGHNGNWNAVEDSEALTSETWYFVAVTYDAASDTMTLYKNGTGVDTATVSDDVTDATIYIGASVADSGGWQGTIDDVRIYSYALSPEQIESLYFNGGDIIVSQETATGEEWQCEVTPFSNAITNEDAGDTRSSDPLIYEARADTDGDGDVDGDDLQLLIQSFNTTFGHLNFDDRCDFDMDDMVDAEDLEIFSREFGDATAAAPLAVPLSTSTLSTNTLETETLETETRANKPARAKSDLRPGAKKRGKKR
jgi:lysophospholipase L1-like esterase